MYVKQLLCISSNHRFSKAYGTWHGGGCSKTSRYCVAYYGAAVNLNCTQNTKINS